MKKVTIVDRTYVKIDKLEIGESFNKADFIKIIYGDYDYFKSRSFDVHLNKAKGLLPEKKFKCIKGQITRLK